MSSKSYDSPLGPMHHARAGVDRTACGVREAASHNKERTRQQTGAERCGCRPGRAPFRGLLFGVKAGVRGVCGADSMRPRFDGVGFGGGEFSCDFDSSSCARERDACQWLLCLL